MNRSLPRRLLLGTTVSLICNLALAAPPQAPGAPGTDTNLDTRARIVHGHVLTLDSHVDVLVPGAASEYGPGQKNQADLDELRRGGIDAVALAIATMQGRMLADTVSAALADIDTLVVSLSKAPRNLNRLRIATLHSLNYCWILPRLRRFTQAHPDVRVTFETGLALTQFDKAGPDLAIRHGDGFWPGLSTEHLMDGDLFPAAAPNLAAVRDPQDVAKLPLITDLALQGWPDWFRSSGLRGIRLPEMHTFNDSTDALRAAALGLGAILARSRLAEPYLRSGELVRLPGPALKARFGYFVVYPAHRRLSQPAAAFVHWLRHEAALESQTL